MVARNILFILNKLHKIVLIELFFLLLLHYLFSLSIIYSAVLGCIFSLLIFIQFSASQYSFLIKKRKGLFFLLYGLRLIIYAVPICLCLYFKNYFNFFIVLIFLFAYQIHFIGFECLRSYKKYKRQKLDGWFS